MGQNDLLRTLTSFFLTYLTLCFHVPLFKGPQWPGTLCSADFPAEVCISLAKCDLPVVIWTVSRSCTCLLRCFCLLKHSIFLNDMLVEFPVWCLSVLKDFPGILWHSKLQNISMSRHINYNSDWPQCFLFCQVPPPPPPPSPLPPITQSVRSFVLLKLGPRNWIWHRITEMYWRRNSTLRSLEVEKLDANEVFPC